MDEVKVNLVVLVQGARMMSEQECSKQLKKPVIIKKGKYAGKQARDKTGNLLWYYKTVPDLTKYDRNVIRVNSTDKKKPDIITFYTRKNKSIKQSINMSQEAYESFISKDMPAGYRAPKNFKPYMPTKSRMDRKLKKWVDGLSVDLQAWKAASADERLQWHLNAIASDLGGVVDSYTVFKD